jgi:hypothetical protein
VKCFIFYERFACGFGGAAGGNTSNGAGINGDEIMFRLLLFKEFRAVGSASGQAQ